MKRVLQMRMFALRIKQHEMMTLCHVVNMSWFMQMKWCMKKKPQVPLDLKLNSPFFIEGSKKQFTRRILQSIWSHLGSPHTPENSLYLQLDIPSWFFNSSKTEQKIKQSKPVTSSLLCKEMARVEGHETELPFIKLNGTITSPNRQLGKSQNLPYLHVLLLKNWKH